MNSGTTPARMQWRYRCDQLVLYLTAEVAGADYALVRDEPYSDRHTERFATLDQLYDHLRVLDAQLGAEGWELLPAGQRAPDRVRPPVCLICPLGQVEVTMRTSSHVHFRCSGCGYAWTLQKPGSRSAHSHSPEPARR